MLVDCSLLESMICDMYCKGMKSVKGVKIQNWLQYKNRGVAAAKKVVEYSGIYTIQYKHIHTQYKHIETQYNTIRYITI